METKKGKGVQWIDFNKPGDEDIELIGKKYGIHPVILDELRGPSARGRVEVEKNYLYFIYYFPVYNKKDGASTRTEVDFIITKDTVITAHYDDISEAMAGIDVNGLGSSLMAMHRILQNFIVFEERQLRHIREKVEAVAKEIFSNKEKEVLRELTLLKRDVSEYRITVRLQEPLFRSLISKGKQFWGDEAEIYLNDLMGEQIKVASQIDDYREAVSDFEHTNNQLMNLKINSAMKTFTALSFLTFPFMLVTGIFSMKTGGMPLKYVSYGFWVVLGIIIAGMALMAVYFKRKEWF